MNYGAVTTWGDSMRLVLTNVLNYIPQLIVAIILLIVGIIVARALGRLVERVINFTRLNKLFHSAGVSDDMNRVGINFNIGYLIGWLVQFFIIIVTLASVSDILMLNQISIFLRNVLNYIPNVFVGVFILAVGLIAGNMLGATVARISSGTSQFSHMSIWLSGLTRWAIIIFAAMTALIQLGVAVSLIQIIFTGIVIAMSLAIGLAFGLGGRDRAHDWLERMNNNMQRGA